MDFATTFAAHKRLIAVHIYRRVGDWQTAHDLSSDVWAKAIAASRSGHGPHTNTLAWLLRIARNAVIDHYRWHGRRNMVDLEACTPMPSPEPSPFDAALADARHEWLERAIKRLTPGQAQVVNLQRQGYSFEEIAAIVGKNETAVKALRHRALGSLRRMAQRRRAQPR